jgi:hypothetical protein
MVLVVFFLCWIFHRAPANQHREQTPINILQKKRSPKMAHLTLFLLLGSASASQFLAVRQASTLGNASFSIVDTSYDQTVKTSDLSFAYKAPHVEATATDENTYYVVSYPLDDPNGVAHMWEFDEDLDVLKEWVQPAGGLSYFDLQYSSIQKKLFGIAVNGTYGRVISFLDSSKDYVTAEYLVTLPYMW